MKFTLCFLLLAWDINVHTDTSLNTYTSPFHISKIVLSIQNRIITRLREVAKWVKFTTRAIKAPAIHQAILWISIHEIIDYLDDGFLPLIILFSFDFRIRARSAAAARRLSIGSTAIWRVPSAATASCPPSYQGYFNDYPPQSQYAHHHYHRDDASCPSFLRGWYVIPPSFFWA